MADFLINYAVTVSNHFGCTRRYVQRVHCDQELVGAKASGGAGLGAGGGAGGSAAAAAAAAAAAGLSTDFSEKTHMLKWVGVHACLGRPWRDGRGKAWAGSPWVASWAATVGRPSGCCMRVGQGMGQLLMGSQMGVQVASAQDARANPRSVYVAERDASW